MNAVVSVCLLACALGIIVYLLSRRETTRRSQYGPAGLSEFRTGLALDECFDRLDSRSDTDLFAYECRRENDGSFLLHLTLHQPSQQPLDTLYTLRLDPGRQTVVTLIFIREPLATKSRCSRPPCWTNLCCKSWMPTAPNDFCGKCFPFCAVFVILVRVAAMQHPYGPVAQLVRAGGS